MSMHAWEGSVNKWEGLTPLDCRIEDLGRPAQFLLPVQKLGMSTPSGKDIRDDLHDFLLAEFGAFTTAHIPGFGIWRDAHGKAVVDDCTQYKVSFKGKDRIPVLLAKLKEVCQLMSEDCIYVEAGQYAGLLYPLKPSP